MNKDTRLFTTGQAGCPVEELLRAVGTTIIGMSCVGTDYSALALDEAGMLDAVNGEEQLYNDWRDA